MSTQQMFLGSGGSGSVVELPAYLTNTDDLVYYIDMHNSESYSGTGTAITDLSGAGENYATTIEGTLNTDWYYTSSDDESSNPAWERDDNNYNGYIRTTNTGSSNLQFGTSPFTVEMWVRPWSGNNHFMCFNFNNDATGGHQSSNLKPYFFMYFCGRDASSTYAGNNRAYVRHYVGNTSNSFNMISSHKWWGYSYNSDQWGQWNYMVLTRSGTTFKMYINSNHRDTENSSTTINFNGDFDRILTVQGWFRCDVEVTWK